MTKKLEGKVAVVTGGGHGIGPTKDAHFCFISTDN